MGIGRALLVCCLLWPGVARAQPDNRPGDRFFFGIEAGRASASAEQFAEPDPGDAGFAFGYETSYWPNDFFGFGLGLQIISVDGGEVGPSATNVDFGLPVMFGFPLRYVQPYGGVWLGLANTKVGEDGDGVRAAVHPIAGVNAYMNRNLRLYVQWESVSYRPGVDAHAQLVMMGARWSPDFFHEMRGRMKFQTLWWSALGTVTGWIVASLAVGD